MGVTLRHNSIALKQNAFYKFEAEFGYFGEHLPGDKIIVRTIFTTDDPIKEAEKMFAILTNGATITTVIQDHMYKATLHDGTIITLRIDYPPRHAPAVGINVRKNNDPAGIVSQKIHFAKRRKN